MAELTDDALMIRFRDGDHAAFDTLFARHHPAVFRLASVMLRDMGAAEEAMQETFVTVMQSARSYQARGRFVPWLMRVTRTRCLNRMAAARARQPASVGHPDIVASPSREPSPADQVAGDETVERVRLAMNDLPPRQREALALYAFEGLAYREIAEALEIPINTVKTLIRRARAALAQALGDAEGADHAE